MTIFYSKKHILHNPPYELYDGVKEPYAEKAARAESIITELQNHNFGTIVAPKTFPLSHVTNVHTVGYVNFLKQKAGTLSKEDILYPSYFLMDTYTPITRGTFTAARASADVALSGAERILSGEQVVYSLCRPPGHHASCNATGGYCFFNNAAIAAEYLSKHGRVAILDIDFHHGNGTQQLFYDRSDVLYVSIHADPNLKFPYNSGFAEERGVGDGKGFTYNFPLPLGITDSGYLSYLRKGIRIIKNYNPTYLIISLGFDTYANDPIGGFALTIPFYEIMAKEIRKLQKQTLIIQEGGYCVEDLGKMAHTFLRGME